MEFDHNVSVDMVKINFKSFAEDKADPDRTSIRIIQRFWDTHLNQGEHWLSAKYTDYAHTWTFPSGDTTVAIMYSHNTQSGKNKKTGAIEWNPNKVDFTKTPDLWRMIQDLLNSSISFELSKVDIAYDLVGVSIHQCTMDRVHKADCRFYMGANGSMTIYSGARGSGGSCKVYDKRREVLDHGGQDRGVLTRFEITYKADLTFLRLPNQPMKYQGGIKPTTIPQLIIMNQPSLDGNIEFEDHLIIAGLQQLPHLYCMMSLYKRKRIKELQCVSTFVPSIDQANVIVLEWFRAFYASIIAR